MRLRASGSLQGFLVAGDEAFTVTHPRMKKAKVISSDVSDVRGIRSVLAPNSWHDYQALFGNARISNELSTITTTLSSNNMH